MALKAVKQPLVPPYDVKKMDSRTYTIRQLTKEFAVSARTLRFYEEENLIAPARRGQTRIYSARDRARIILILRGRRMGFSLNEIREFLDFYNPESDLKQLLLAKQRFEERIAAFERQMADIDATVNELKAVLAEVDAQLVQRKDTPETTPPDPDPAGQAKMGLAVDK
ncbi:MAG: MerR family DNA-binding transcriptional regulator [Rhizomicrobium sp.]